MAEVDEGNNNEGYNDDNNDNNDDKLNEMTERSKLLPQEGKTRSTSTMKEHETDFGGREESQGEAVERVKKNFPNLDTRSIAVDFQINSDDEIEFQYGHRNKWYLLYDNETNIELSKKAKDADNGRILKILGTPREQVYSDPSVLNNPSLVSEVNKRPFALEPVFEIIDENKRKEINNRNIVLVGETAKKMGIQAKIKLLLSYPDAGDLRYKPIELGIIQGGSRKTEIGMRLLGENNKDFEPIKNKDRTFRKKIREELRENLGPNSDEADAQLEVAEKQLDERKKNAESILNNPDSSEEDRDKAKETKTIIDESFERLNERKKLSFKI